MKSYSAAFLAVFLLAAAIVFFEQIPITGHSIHLVLNSVAVNPSVLAGGEVVVFTGNGTWQNNVKLLCGSSSGGRDICPPGISRFSQNPRCSYVVPPTAPDGVYDVFCRLLDTIGDESNEAMTQYTVRSPSTCGNAVVEGTEECDDGNTVGGDGCSAICTSEEPPALNSIYVPPQSRRGSEVTVTSNATSPAGNDIQLQCGISPGFETLLCPGSDFVQSDPTCIFTLSPSYPLGPLLIYCRAFDANLYSGVKSNSTEVIPGGPILTALTADPETSMQGETIVLTGTGNSPGRTVKLRCGRSPGASDVCTSPVFEPADPSCAFDVPLDFPVGVHNISCRITDNGVPSQVSNERAAGITIVSSPG